MAVEGECPVMLADSVDGFAAQDFTGFHADWSYPMAGERVLAMLRGSAVAVIAVRGPLAPSESGRGEVVGYAAAISDGTVFAYLSSVEVRTACRGRGIGTRLVQRVLERCRELYAVDLCCDASLERFYEPLGFQRVTGMCVRNRKATGRIEKK